MSFYYKSLIKMLSFFFILSAMLVNQCDLLSCQIPSNGMTPTLSSVLKPETLTMHGQTRYHSFHLVA